METAESLLPGTITPALNHPLIHSDPPLEGHTSQDGTILKTRLQRASKNRDIDRDLGETKVIHSLLKAHTVEQIKKNSPPIKGELDFGSSTLF